MNPGLRARLLAAERRAVDLERRLRRLPLLDPRSLEEGLASLRCLVVFNFTVTDSATGSPLAGAAVTLYSSAGFAVAAGTTLSDGTLYLPAGAADTYSYAATLSGYAGASAPIAASSCSDVTAVPVALAAAPVPCNFVVNGFAKAGGQPDQFATVTLHGGGVNNSGATTSTGFYQLVRNIVPGTAMTVNAFDNLGRHSQTINTTSVCGTVSLADLILV